MSIYSHATFSSLPLANDTFYCYPLRNILPTRRKSGVFGLTGDDRDLVSHESWPGDVYPDHCMGKVYVLTPSLARRLVNATDAVPFHKIGDQYVTGFLRTAVSAKIGMLSCFWLLHTSIWDLISR